LIQRQRCARSVGELLELDPRVAIEPRHRLHELLGRQAAAGPIGDRAAGGNQADGRQRRWRALLRAGRCRVGERGHQDTEGDETRRAIAGGRLQVHALTIPESGGAAVRGAYSIEIVLWACQQRQTHGVALGATERQFRLPKRDEVLGNEACLHRSLRRVS
jgi:hypothetical protein